MSDLQSIIDILILKTKLFSIVQVYSYETCTFLLEENILELSEINTCENENIFNIMLRDIY